MTTAVAGKEEEIARLLAEGITPVDLIKRGFRRATVYKVNRRVQTGGTPQEDASVPATDRAVEDDPQILELKKALRKAELERQIEEIRGPSSAESRLLALEENAETSAAALAEVIDDHDGLEQRVDGSPLSGLRERFECSCGVGGMVAAKVVCTSCGAETSYGWSPKNS